MRARARRRRRRVGTFSASRRPRHAMRSSRKSKAQSAPPPEVAARLYALPPDAFVRARESLARELAAADDPRAAAVRKLRRPVGSAWVLDRLAVAEREKVDALAAAGDALRAAARGALEGRGAEAVRAAETRVHEVARALRLAAAGA